MFKLAKNLKTKLGRNQRNSAKKRAGNLDKTMNVRFGLLSAASVGFFFSGCQTVTTAPEPIDKPVHQKALVGQYYFLPKKRLQIIGTHDGSIYTVTLAEIMEADHRHRYFARQRKNVLYDDHTVITTDAKGLLAAVNVTSTDQTPAIIDSIADTIINLAKIAANASGWKVAEAGGMPPPFDVIFDPFSQAEIKAANKTMDPSGFQITAKPLPPINADFSRQVTKGAPPAPEGISFRPPTIMSFEFASKEGSPTNVYRKFGVTLPDQRTISTLPYNREFLVGRTLNATFTEGMLSSVDYTLPSQVKAAIGIPASIIGKVSEALPDLITVRNANRNAGADAETARLNAQAGVLNAQAAVITARKALKDAQKEQ